MTERRLLDLVGGNKDFMNVVEGWLLASVTEDYVRMVVRSAVEERKKLLAERDSSGYYEEFSGVPDGFDPNAHEWDDPLAVQYRANNGRMLERNRDVSSLEFAEYLLDCVNKH